MPWKCAHRFPYNNKFPCHQGVFFAAYGDFRSAVQDIEQFNGRMPVGWEIRTTVGLIADGDIFSLQVIQMSVKRSLHKKPPKCQY